MIPRTAVAVSMLVLVLASPAAAKPPAEIVLPSESCQGLFVVPVTVRETTLHLVLDTGSSRTWVDPRAAGRALGRESKAAVVEFQEARIGEHSLGALDAFAYSMETLGRALGRKIDGILGFPAFHDVLLILDYPADQIRVAEGSLPKPDGREVFRSYGTRRPHLKVDVGGRTVKVLVDSGATGRLAIEPTAGLAWSHEPRPVGASVLFAGVEIKESGRLRGDVRFGSLTFEDPVVSVATHGRLAGWHVLRHFVLTFDQENKRIRLQPDVTSKVRMGPHVGSGLGIHPRPQGMEIIRVFPGTSAAAAGLREGDLVTAIDGTPVYERGCEEPEGKPAGVRQVWSYLRDGLPGEAEIEREVLVP